MPRPTAAYVERKLWLNYLRRIGRKVCLRCNRPVWKDNHVGKGEDSSSTLHMGREYMRYLRQRERAGVVSTKQGWRYKDEVP